MFSRAAEVAPLLSRTVSLIVEVPAALALAELYSRFFDNQRASGAKEGDAFRKL